MHIYILQEKEVSSLVELDFYNNIFFFNLYFFLFNKLRALFDGVKPQFF